MNKRFVSELFIVILRYNDKSMGLTKTEIFTNEQNELAKVAKTLGHPARIAILQHMMTMKSCICGDLVNEIGLAQATISQHLKELKNLGIIQGNIEGTSVCYCINGARWSEITNMLSNFMARADGGQSCC